MVVAPAAGRQRLELEVRVVAEGLACADRDVAGVVEDGVVLLHRLRSGRGGLEVPIEHVLAVARHVGVHLGIVAHLLHLLEGVVAVVALHADDI